MSKFKTLNNIVRCPTCDCIDEACVDHAALRQEAIKWIEHLEIQLKANPTCEHAPKELTELCFNEYCVYVNEETKYVVKRILIEWINNFFNIDK